MRYRSLLLMAGGLGISQQALAADVLYCNDYNLSTDRMAAALTSLAGEITTTSTSSITTCESSIASGDWDLVILAIQNNSYSTPNFNAYVSAGGVAILQDWTMDSTRGALFGVSYSSSNYSAVTVSSATLASGLASNPFSLTNPGWGIYSMSMSLRSGATSLGTFSSGSSIVTANGGRTIVNGFLTDTGGASATTLYVNEIRLLLDLVDADGDGYVASDDCDDTDASVYPGADEYCDDVDNDCDGTTDEADAVDAVSWYADTDGDGYGNGALAATACEAPTDYVADDSDCDDASASVHPGAAEVVGDGIDQDCDAAETCYVDADADGWRTDGTVASADADCTDAGEALASAGLDCDDTSAAIHPAATDATGDGVDSDCDGEEVCYLDADDDGYRPDASATIVSTDADCTDAREARAVEPVGDCDDADASIHPGATDTIGDGVDADCDGEETCYVDADGDGARTEFVVSTGDADCDDAGEALSSAPLDCDDTAAFVYPGAAEITGSGIDEDCDGAELCYVDADADGYRPDETSTVASADADCADAGEALASALVDDCDDTDAAFNPGAIEDDCTDPNDYNCDGVTGYADDDADGWAACAECDDLDRDVYPGAAEIAGDLVDSDCDGFDLCYVDADDDGYRPGDETIEGTTVACDGPGEAPLSDPDGDCDDMDISVHPGAPEATGDDLDADCDGGEICYVDADGDGYRTGETVVSLDADCDDAGEAPASASLDCDDTNAAISPSGAEVVGDGVDGDCDGEEVCLVDADDDGFRLDDETTVASPDADCADPGEALASDPSDDCDDTDATVFPGAEETVGDGIDADCDGGELCLVDADDDGYRADDEATVASEDADCDDAGEALASALDGDCDDADAAFHPGATEDDCTDPSDYNCDGSVGYVDGDEDGHPACAECDDADAAVFPGAEELPGDLVDQDCDGFELCLVDADDDGYRPDDTTVSSANVACDGAGEAVASDPDGDCDDADGAVFPTASEIPGDAVDQDCDGTELCFVDADEDGYRPDAGALVTSEDIDCDDAGEALADAGVGDCDDADAAYNPGAAEDDCTDPADYNCDGSSGYADADTDGFAACEECDDNAFGVNPDADEVCNGVDDDCDGTIDVDAVDATTWYADADGDGYTDTATVTGCEPPAGYVAEPSAEPDCDDDDAVIYPGADDPPGDDVDQDCDGADTVEVPDDGDPKGGGGCGCASTTAPSAGWTLLGLVPLLFARRRR